MDALPLPAVVIDESYTIVYANRSWTAFLGAHPGRNEAEGYVQAWSCWNDPDRIEAIRANVYAVLCGDSRSSSVQVACGHAPNAFWIQVQAVPVRIDAHLHVLITHSYSMLEPRQQTPQPDADFFRDAFQTSCIGAVILAATGEIRQANASFCMLVGYAEQELLVATFPSLAHVDDRRLWRHELQRLERGEVPRIQIALRVLHRQGGAIWVLLSASRLHGRPGEPQHIVVQAQDISDRGYAEEELRRQALTFENISDGVILTHDAGVILDWNPAAKRILGFTRDEVLGTNVKDLISPGLPDLFERIQEKLTLQQRWEGEITLRGKDGSTRVCEGVAAPLMDDGAGSLTALYFLRDVTEARRLETQLQHAQKMEAVGRLAGGVAHDFNNLLTVVNGYSELLLGEFPPDTPQRQRILEIKLAAERAASLTRQLLAYSRRQVLAPSLFDLNTVIENMAPMLRRLIGEDIEFEVKLSHTPLWVKADAGQIDQVILNLAVNARDAIPQAGKIIIESLLLTSPHYISATTRLSPEEFIVLSLRDTGVGMSPEVQAHIFEPFFTTKKQGQGTGLGLAMVYGIIRQSGGYIQVHSAPGKGSCFNIYLPRVNAPAEKADSAPEVSVSAQSVRETLLVVEDEEGVRSLICDVLSQQGYRVLDAAGSQEALQRASQFTGAIDLMITDVVMPYMGGRELAQRMMPLRPRMRVLYISGYTDDAVVRHGVQESRMAFLQKPFSPAHLRQKVRQMLDGASQAPSAPS